VSSRIHAQEGARAAGRLEPSCFRRACGGLRASIPTALRALPRVRGHALSDGVAAAGTNSHPNLFRHCHKPPPDRTLFNPGFIVADRGRGSNGAQGTFFGWFSSTNSSLDGILKCPLAHAPFDFASLGCARDRQGRRGSDARSGFHFAANFPRPVPQLLYIRAEQIRAESKGFAGLYGAISRGTGLE